MEKEKAQLEAESSMVRELVLSEGWKSVVRPWIEKIAQDSKDEMANGVDHDKYFQLVGAVQSFNLILLEVDRLGNRKSE